MRTRTLLAITAGKGISSLCRSLAAGGGTTLPGRLALKIDPELLKELTGGIAGGSVIITGTNGKTTTTAMLESILSRAGYNTAGNFSGANLAAGAASMLISRAALGGRLDADLALLETDEASLPHVAEAVSPRLLIVTNLFRDQLDRYGEIDSIADFIRRGLGSLQGDGCALLNADDPRVAALGRESGVSVRYYGLDASQAARAGEESVSESRRCPLCAAPLLYSRVHYGHLGHYACSSCSFRRPDPQYRLQSIIPLAEGGSRLSLTGPEGSFEARISLPGIYNIYNALAAAAAALITGVSMTAAEQGLASFKSVFGRMESLEMEGRRLYIVLAKNPAGMNEALQAMLDAGLAKNMLIAINDNYADGRDISWLWDAEFEMLRAGRQGPCRLGVTGTRCRDMLLRLKYAGLSMEDVLLRQEPGLAFQESLKRTLPGECLCIICNYTSMMQIRRAIERMGYLDSFWRRQQHAASNSSSLS